MKKPTSDEDDIEIDFGGQQPKGLDLSLNNKKRTFDEFLRKKSTAEDLNKRRKV